MAGFIKTVQNTTTLPAGTILPWGGSTAPTGYLLCDGSAVSRTTYANLYAAISTNFGIGDGSTTFNIPDPRAAALAGAGTSTGYTENETLVLGTKYNDQFQAWQAGATEDASGARNLYGRVDDRDQLVSYSGAAGFSLDYMRTTTQGVASRIKAMNDGTNGEPRTGKTTRGKLIGVNFIIKY